MLTLNEIFTRVKTHLLTQNERAMTPGHTCRYRAPGGLSCAVGCLIPDERYSPQMEGAALLYVLKLIPGMPEDLSYASTEYRLLADLQTLHDQNLPVKWPELLDQVATEYGLTDTQPTAIPAT